MAYTKQQLIEALKAFQNSAKELNITWQDLAAQHFIDGDDFRDKYPFEVDFDELAKLAIPQWVTTSVDYIHELIRHETIPYTFDEFRSKRTCYIVEQYVEIYGDIAPYDHDDISVNNIGLVYTYTGGLKICAMRNGKFALVIENSDWLELDLMFLERKLYDYYLLDFGGAPIMNGSWMNREKGIYGAQKDI